MLYVIVIAGVSVPVVVSVPPSVVSVEPAVVSVEPAVVSVEPAVVSVELLSLPQAATTSARPTARAANLLLLLVLT
jgi:hypothetical protein